MAQIVVKDDTIYRIEAIIGKRFSRGGDKCINELIDMFWDLQDDS